MDMHFKFHGDHLYPEQSFFPRSIHTDLICLLKLGAGAESRLHYQM